MQKKEISLLTEGRILDTGQVYRVLTWVSRLLGIGFLMSIFMNIMAVILILNLFPLKQVVPFFITLTPKSDQVVKVEPLDIETQGSDIMTEALAKNYVKLRESIDFQTEKNRWHQVYGFSSTEIFEEFKKLMDPKEGILEIRKTKKIYRDVLILAVSTLSKNPRIVQVEWQSKDYQEGGEVYKRNWVSTLSIAYNSQKVRFEDRHLNPLGFTVIAYGVSEKEGGHEE